MFFFFFKINDGFRRPLRLSSIWLTIGRHFRLLIISPRNNLRNFFRFLCLRLLFLHLRLRLLLCLCLHLLLRLRLCLLLHLLILLLLFLLLQRRLFFFLFLPLRLLRRFLRLLLLFLRPRLLFLLLFPQCLFRLTASLTNRNRTCDGSDAKCRLPSRADGG